MADRTTFPVKGLNLETVEVCGSFAPNTAVDPAAATLKGEGWSVEHTSTGLFTITLDDVWPSLLSATATLQLATAADQFVQIGVYTAASKTLEIRVVDKDGNVEDVAIDDDNRVNFSLVFSNTSA